MAAPGQDLQVQASRTGTPISFVESHPPIRTHPMLSRSTLLTACALAATTASATAFQSTTFGPQQVITTNANLCSSVDAADLDGDGDADVISSSAGDDKVAWYRNKNASGFTGQKVISNGIGDTLFVHAADLDGDGQHKGESISSK